MEGMYVYPSATFGSRADECGDLGVLCVHGIGTQEEGDALLAVSDALLAEMASYGGAVSYHQGLLKPGRERSSDPAHLWAVVERSAPVDDSLLADDGVGDDDGDGDGDGDGDDFERAPSAGPPSVESIRLLLAESHWAQAFDPPSYGRVLGWLLSHGTWIVIRHMVFRLSTPLRWVERRYERRSKPVPQWFDMIEGTAGFPGALISIVLVAIPLQLAFLAGGLLAAIPIRATRRAAARFALGVSAILGDASVYTANPTIRVAIQTRVRRDLEWLRVRSRRVVVFAHSQGAAVAFDVLRGLPNLDGVHLITYGAGIRKLRELEEDARNRPLIVRLCPWLWILGIVLGVLAWYSGAYLAESLAALSSPQGAAAQAISDRVGSTLVFYSLVLVSTLAFFFYIARAQDEDIDRTVREDLSQLLKRGLHWVDLYASSDPVPGGPLLGERWKSTVHDGWHGEPGLAGFRSRRVVNRMSSLFDHTTYWQRPNDFVPAVAEQLRSWLGLAPVRPALDLGRLRRIVYRKIAGLLLGAAAVAVYFRVGSPLREVLFEPAWSLLPIDSKSLTGTMVDHYGLRDLAISIAGLATNVILVLLYGRFVLDPNWDAWERTVQRYREDAYAGADNLMGVLSKLGHEFMRPTRALICLLLVAVPMGLLASIVERRSFQPAVGSLLSAAEAGRSTAAWMFSLFALLGLGFVFIEWLARLRGREQGA
jgi:hypothetical protein